MAKKWYNKYPSYVNQFRPKETIIKKVNDVYYVYKATSKRVEGKKYPVQVIEGVIGKIDEYGFHDTEKVKLNQDVIVRECGFTNLILKYKDTFMNETYSRFKKQDREIILYSLIYYLSSNTYIQDKYRDKILPIQEVIDKYKLSIGRQIKIIERIMETTLKEIEELKYICRVYIGEREIKTKITKRQKEIIEKLMVDEDELK